MNSKNTADSAHKGFFYQEGTETYESKALTYRLEEQDGLVAASVLGNELEWVWATVLRVEQYIEESLGWYKLTYSPSGSRSDIMILREMTLCEIDALAKLTDLRKGDSIRCSYNPGKKLSNGQTPVASIESMEGELLWMSAGYRAAVSQQAHDSMQ